MSNVEPVYDLSSIPVRPKPKPKPESTLAEIMAGAMNTLADKLSAPRNEMVTMAQVELMLASRDAFWSEKLVSLLGDLAKASEKPRAYSRLVPKYDANDRLVSIELVE
jgi:hypothetical protein